MKTSFVTDLLSDQTITSFFLVHEKEVRNTREGRAYLRLELGDRSGTIEARMWDQFELLAKSVNRDDFVKVQARVEVYKNRPQLAVLQLRIAKPEEIDIADYLPHTAADVEKMWTELLVHAESIHNPWLKTLVLQIVCDPHVTKCYKRAPAAKVMHHAYIGGLLEHVVSLCKMARLVAAHYAELSLDLLLTAAILHDVGKLEELCYERAIGYTTEGQLLGHIVMELETVSHVIDKIEGFPAPLKTVVQHLLISHHGQYEFGSPKLPMIREALVFHYLDDLDSKLSAARVALATPSGDDEWSAYSSALGRRFLNLDQFLNPQPSAGDPSSVSEGGSAFEKGTLPTPARATVTSPVDSPAVDRSAVPGLPAAGPQPAASQAEAANENSAAAKPTANSVNSQQPSLRPPLENSHSKPAPKPKSEQSFLRKLFS